MIIAMNDKRLTQVLDGVSEATAFAPGESRQLAPAVSIEDKAMAAKNTIIESAVALAADMKALYRERVEYWQRRFDAVSEIADQLVARSQKTAEEVAELTTRDRQIAADYAHVAHQHGIELGGGDEQT